MTVSCAVLLREVLRCYITELCPVCKERIEEVISRLEGDDGH